MWERAQNFTLLGKRILKLDPCHCRAQSLLHPLPESLAVAVAVAISGRRGVRPGMTMYLVVVSIVLPILLFLGAILGLKYGSSPSQCLQCLRLIRKETRILSEPQDTMYTSFEDANGRCQNCLHLKKNCHFFPVD